MCFFWLAFNESSCKTIFAAFRMPGDCDRKLSQMLGNLEKSSINELAIPPKYSLEWWKN